MVFIFIFPVKPKIVEKKRAAHSDRSYPQTYTLNAVTAQLININILSNAGDKSNIVGCDCGGIAVRRGPVPAMRIGMMRPGLGGVSVLFISFFYAMTVE